jgi:hypothetical protein
MADSDSRAVQGEQRACGSGRRSCYCCCYCWFWDGGEKKEDRRWDGICAWEEGEREWEELVGVKPPGREDRKGFEHNTDYDGGSAVWAALYCFFVMK